MFLENQTKNVKRSFAFFESTAFSSMFALFVFVFWLLDLTFVGALLSLLLSAFVFSVCRDSKPNIAITMLMVFVINANEFTMSGIIILSVGVFFVLVGMIVHLVRFKPSFSFLHPKKIKGYTFAVLLILPAIALGGISMLNRNPIMVLIVILGVTAVSLAYIFFYATTKNNKKDELLKFIIRTVMIMGVLLSAQMLTILIRAGSIENIKLAIEYRQFALSWAHPNNVAILLALSIPMTLYYAVTLKKWAFVPVLIAIAEFGLIFLTTSRGAILITAVALPIMAIYIFLNARNRRHVGALFGICAVVAIVLVYLFRGTIQELFGRLFDLGLSDNGRFELYRNAIELFKSAPIFGVGLDHGFGIWGTYQLFWIHSTPIQILACFGIFGVLCFAYFFFARYRAFFIKLSPAKIVVLVGLLLLEVYGLVDIVFFYPYTYVLMMILCLGAEKSLDENQGLAFPKLKNNRSIESNVKIKSKKKVELNIK